MGFSPQLSQVMRFLGAGGPGALLYYLILYILTDVIGVWYMVSAVIASVANHSSNFVLQKFWTFEDKDTKDIYWQASMQLWWCLFLYPTFSCCMYWLNMCIFGIS